MHETQVLRTEFIGLIYEGLLDYKLKRTDDTFGPQLFLNIGSYLSSLLAGEITDTGEVERFLAAVWDGLIGDDGGMEGYKLLNRMENVRWETTHFGWPCGSYRSS